jgi:hypothetical protein
MKMISKKLCRVLIAVTVAVLNAPAQTWSGSGSTGADGSLVLTTTDSRVSNGLFIFDPVRDNLDVNGTNIYNFTTVTIPVGVTVQIRANKLRQPGPVIWLASGAVTIAGVLDVSGNNGLDSNIALDNRAPSQPGPGGFPGGAGGKPGDVPQRGFGPGGGLTPSGTGTSGCSAGFATSYTPNASSAYGPASRCANGGGSYGDIALQPLLGGSGGSGGYPSANGNLTGPGGGAGGGAIRITSSVGITIANGNCCTQPASGIYANGGNPGLYSTGGSSSSGDIIGGAGSGGSIHLQAPFVALNAINGDSAYVFANGGTYSVSSLGPESASPGRIRIDTNSLQQTVNNTGSATINPAPLVGPLVNVPLPTNLPSVTVVSINGTPVPANPTAAYTVPDVTINNTGNIPVVISTQNIPNTTINLHVTTEPGTADSITPVTLVNGTGTANITLPQGVSRFVVRATW